MQTTQDLLFYTDSDQIDPLFMMDEQITDGDPFEELPPLAE